MSLQPDNGAKALLKHFFTFGALQMLVWLVIGAVLWFASRWVPIWVLGLIIVAILGAVLLLGNPQNAQKRADMLKDIPPPK